MPSTALARATKGVKDPPAVARVVGGKRGRGRAGGRYRAAVHKAVNGVGERRPTMHYSAKKIAACAAATPYPMC
jgi:hypothetical protein